MNKQIKTVIIQMESLCCYSMVSTTLNAKYSLNTIYPNKIEYRFVKQLFSDLGINVDYNISDEAPLYAEYYDGFRMAKEHYYNDLVILLM